MCAVEQSGFVAEFLPGLDLRGREVIAFVVKRSYALNAFEGRLDVLAEQPPVRVEDEFYEDEAELVSPSVRHEAELCLDKPGADVVFLGAAYAPGGQPSPSFDCALRIGRRVRSLRIFGPRHCRYVPPKKQPKPDKETGRIDESLLPPPEFGEPEPVLRVPLRMSNAYGGESLLVPSDPEMFAPSAEDVDAAKDAAPEAEAEANDSPFTEDGTRQVDVSELSGADLDGYGDQGSGGTDAEGTRVLDGDVSLGEDRDWDARLRADFAEEKGPVALVDAGPDWPRIACPQNPVGKGFALGNHAETIDGLALPLIEDPERPLRPADIPRSLEGMMDAEQAIQPAGFGWLPRHWWPRSTLAGVNPAELEEAQKCVDEQVVALDPDDAEERARAEGLIDFEVPVVQPDYPRGAPIGLRFDSLAGDEEIELTNLSESGGVFFRLPGDHPRLTLDRGRGDEPVALRLDTLSIDGEQSEVVLVWRGRLAYGGPDEFAGYPRFDLTLYEGDVEEVRAQETDEALRKREADGDIDTADEPVDSATKIQRAYEDSLVDPAPEDGEGETTAEAGGTRVYRAIDDERAPEDAKVVSDEAFSDWVAEGTPEGEDPPPDEAEALRRRKEALRERLAERADETGEGD